MQDPAILSAETAPVQPPPAPVAAAAAPAPAPVAAAPVAAQRTPAVARAPAAAAAKAPTLAPTNPWGTASPAGAQQQQQHAASAAAAAGGSNQHRAAAAGGQRAAAAPAPRSDGAPVVQQRPQHAAAAAGGHAAGAGSRATAGGGGGRGGHHGGPRTGAPAGQQQQQHQQPQQHRHEGGGGRGGNGQGRQPSAPLGTGASLVGLRTVSAGGAAVAVVTKHEPDFDLQAANAKFNKEAEMAKLGIGSAGPDAPTGKLLSYCGVAAAIRRAVMKRVTSDGSHPVPQRSSIPTHASPAHRSADDAEAPQTRARAAVAEVAPAYDKAKGFFDTLTPGTGGEDWVGPLLPPPPPLARA